MTDSTLIIHDYFTEEGVILRSRGYLARVRRIDPTRSIVTVDSIGTLDLSDCPRVYNQWWAKLLGHWLFLVVRLNIWCWDKIDGVSP